MAERKGAFTIHRTTCELRVEGIVIYPFGLDKRSELLDDEAGWYVTHIPSGLTFPCCPFKNQKEARAFVRRLEPKSPIWSAGSMKRPSLRRISRWCRMPTESDDLPCLCEGYGCALQEIE